MDTKPGPHPLADAIADTMVESLSDEQFRALMILAATSVMQIAEDFASIRATLEAMLASKGIDFRSNQRAH